MTASLRLRIDDYALEEFLPLAAHYGQESYAYVVTPNVDHVIRYHDDPVFRDTYDRADYVLLDSRFLAAILRLAKRVRPRVCPGSDLTAHLLPLIARDDTIVLIGASDAQCGALAHRYGLAGIRHYNPPMGFINQPDEVQRCLRFVEAHSPFRFCFLAVGSPQQEMLALELKRRGIARGLVLCIGASINFLTGAERRAPRWLQRLCLEWLYRLLQDPRRMARRYLLRGPRVFALLPHLELQLRRALPSQRALQPGA